MIQIDMPMPDNCLECRFNTSEFGYCNAMPVEFVGQVSDCEEDDKPEWCPLKAQEPITGETSDGYHTFNELYHHRAVLFSVIVVNYPERAWKSKKHHDGTMYGSMFIVGIETPDGQATYHYDIEPYWDMFKCRVLDNAPEWDGHTPAQAIERIGRLKAQEPPTDASISSAIECLMHPQDADDSDMAKAIDTAVCAMRMLKVQKGGKVE